MTVSSRLVYTAIVSASAILIVMGIFVARRPAIRSKQQTVPTNGAAQQLRTPPQPPFLLVQSTRADVSSRKLLLVPIEAPERAAFETPLSCDRAGFAGSRGVCLVMETGRHAYQPQAHVFDDRFEVLRTIPLSGVPNRIRLSADGRLAAISVLEHTHADPLFEFTPRTIVVNTYTGAIRDLRHFTFIQDGRRIQARHLGVWGVSFANDGRRFFATLEVDTTKHLIEGDLETRTATVIHSAAECPSISPDNTRIVYKRRTHVDDDALLYMYDLRSGAAVRIAAETRSIVDQVEWLDNARLVYHLTGARGADVWTVDVDKADPPRILREYAYAPAVVR